MKLRLAAVCATLFLGWLLSAVAGDIAPASGVKIVTVPDTIAAPGVPTSTGPAFNAQESASGAASQAGSSSSSDVAGSSGSVASNGSSSAAGPTSRGTDTSAGSIFGSKDSKDVSTKIAHEEVIDTGDKAVEADKTAKAEPADKTFQGHPLDVVSDISNVSGQKDPSSASDKEASPVKQDASSKDKDDPQKKN